MTNLSPMWYPKFCIQTYYYTNGRNS